MTTYHRPSSSIQIGLYPYTLGFHCSLLRRQESPLHGRLTADFVRCRSFIICSHFDGVGKAIIACEILCDLYAIRPRGSTSPTYLKTEAAKLEQKLQAWSDELPENLRLDTQEQIILAPAHILSLHMQRECALTAVQFAL